MGPVAAVPVGAVPPFPENLTKYKRPALPNPTSVQVPPRITMTSPGLAAPQAPLEALPEVCTCRHGCLMSPATAVASSPVRLTNRIRPGFTMNVCGVNDVDFSLPTCTSTGNATPGAGFPTAPICTVSCWMSGPQVTVTGDFRATNKHL